MTPSANRRRIARDVAARAVVQIGAGVLLGLRSRALRALRIAPIDALRTER